MTKSRETSSVTELAATLSKLPKGTRQVVAIAGAPGSGKSTLAEVLQDRLRHTGARSVEIVPMDGFHFDDAVLAQMGWLDRKGAPETFDLNGFAALLQRLSQGCRTEDIAVPVFDRELELSRAAGRLISRDTEILLVEGNYLLLKDAGWDALRTLFDLTVMIESDLKTLHERLLARWAHFGFDPDQARLKAEGNDLPNARRVIKDSRRADILVSARWT